MKKPEAFKTEDQTPCLLACLLAGWLAGWLADWLACLLLLWF